jgi:hypothetical protein
LLAIVRYAATYHYGVLMDWTQLFETWIQFAKNNGAIIGAAGTALGTLLGYGLRYYGERKKQKSERLTAMRRLRSQLRRLEIHYAIAGEALKRLDIEAKVGVQLELRKQKINDMRYLHVPDDDWQHYSDELSFQVLSLALLVRNNDLHIDNFISSASKLDLRQKDELKTELLSRMQGVGSLCQELRKDVEAEKWRHVARRSMDDVNFAYRAARGKVHSQVLLDDAQLEALEAARALVRRNVAL